MRPAARPRPRHPLGSGRGGAGSVVRATGAEGRPMAWTPAVVRRIRPASSRSSRAASREAGARSVAAARRPGVSSWPSIRAVRTARAGASRPDQAGVRVGGADAGPELLEDVGEAANQGGAVADELVAAGGARVPGGSWEDEDMADAAGAGGPGRGEAAGVLGRLDHHDRGGEGGDQAVARQEVGRSGLAAGRVLAGQGPAGGPDPGEQAGVGPGIGNVEAAAQDDNGGSTGVQGPGVGGRVDADGAAADHAPAGAGQPGPDGPGGGAAQRRGAASADHRDRRRRLRRGRPGDEEPGTRWVGRRGRQRPAFVARDQEPQPEGVEPRGHGGGLGAVGSQQARRLPALGQPGRDRRRQRPRGGRQRQQHLPLPHARGPPGRAALWARHVRPHRRSPVRSTAITRARQAKLAGGPGRRWERRPLGLRRS